MTVTTTTPDLPTGIAPPDGTPPVRLALVAPMRGDDATLDGAWWPRSRSMVDELPGLLVHLHRRGIRVTRVAYALQSWDVAPRRLLADGTVVRLGWFPGLDPHLVRLTGGGGQLRLDLLVVPPGAGEAVAGRAMTMAAARQNHAGATAVLTNVGALPDPGPAGLPHGEDARARTCPACGSMPLPGGHCECSYAAFDARNHPLRAAGPATAPVRPGPVPGPGNSGIR